MCQCSQRLFISSDTVNLPGVGGKGFHHIQPVRKPSSLSLVVGTRRQLSGFFSTHSVCWWREGIVGAFEQMDTLMMEGCACLKGSDYKRHFAKITKITSVLLPFPGFSALGHCSPELQFSPASSFQTMLCLVVSHSPGSAPLFPSFY